MDHILHQFVIVFNDLLLMVIISFKDKVDIRSVGFYFVVHQELF